MKRALKIALLLLLTPLAYCPALAAQSSWTPQQKQGAAVMLSAIAMDCTTTQIAMTQSGFYERNPLLGRHPSPARLWSSCAVAAVTSLEVANLLGRKRRGWFLAAVWTVETVVVGWNITKLVD